MNDRIIYVEESVKKYFSSCIEKRKPVAGVIIGKVQTSTTFVVKAVCCPEKDDGKTSTFQLDGEWLGGTAVEVGYMLPGGLYVVGIFVIASQNAVNLESLRMAIYRTFSVVTHLRKILFDVYNIEEIPFLWTGVHIDIENGFPVICKQFAIAEDKLLSATALWVYENNATKWGFVETHLALNETLLLEEMTSSVRTQLKAAVSLYCNKIAKSIVEVDGSLLGDALLFDNTNRHNLRPRDATVKQNRWGRKAFCRFNVLYPGGVPVDKELKFQTFNFTVRICGSIFACAYLPTGTTIEETIQELKKDAILNINHRCNLIAEGLEFQGKETLAHNSVVCLPKRLAFTDGKWGENFMYFDYKYRNENLETCVSRIKETFDLVLTTDKLHDDIEDYYIAEDLLVKERFIRAALRKLKHFIIRRWFMIVFIFLAMLVAFLAYIAEELEFYLPDF